VRRPFADVRPEHFRSAFDAANGRAEGGDRGDYGGAGGGRRSRIRSFRWKNAGLKLDQIASAIFALTGADTK